MRAAKSDTSGARNGDFDPNLQLVIEAWPHLPESIKTQVLELVEQAKVK